MSLRPTAAQRFVARLGLPVEELMELPRRLTEVIAAATAPTSSAETAAT